MEVKKVKMSLHGSLVKRWNQCSNDTNESRVPFMNNILESALVRQSQEKRAISTASDKGVPSIVSVVVFPSIGSRRCLPLD